MTTYNALTEGCYGDGVHDDTSALQTILDALTASDKLYLPAGSYLLSYPGIAPPSGAYVYGVGPTSILYHPDDGEYRNMIELSGVTSCTMRDLKIMSSLAGTASKVRGIHGNGSAVNVTLRRSRQESSTTWTSRPSGQTEPFSACSTSMTSRWLTE